MTSDLTPANVRCEYLANPLGSDVARPRAFAQSLLQEATGSDAAGVTMIVVKPRACGVRWVRSAPMSSVTFSSSEATARFSKGMKDRNVITRSPSGFHSRKTMPRPLVQSLDANALTPPGRSWGRFPPRGREQAQVEEIVALSRL